MNPKKCFYVYIMASKRYGTLYIGITSDIVKRASEHKSGIADGFTKKYKIKMLVYYERHETAESAIVREKQMKEWKRSWKLELIEKSNPNWHDLYDHLLHRARL